MVTTFLFTACATSGPDLSGELGNQIKSAANEVTMLKTDTPQLCQTISSCKYVGGFLCTSDQVNKNDDCMKNAKTTTVVYGGDAFLTHTAQKVSGGSAMYPNEDYYRLYGQIYNCSNKNLGLHKQYATSQSLPVLVPVRAESAAFAKQCKTLERCKKFRSINRSSISADPFNRIMMDYGKIQGKYNNQFNYLVINSDIFNKAGFYRLYTDAYQCK